MNPLLWIKALSPRAWLEIGVALALLVGAVLVGHEIDVHNKRVRAEGYAAGLAEVQAKWDAAELVRAKTAAAAEAAERAEEQRRAAADVENRHEAQRLATRSLSDHAAAAAERQRLLDEADRTAAAGSDGGGAGRDPSATFRGAATEALRDVLGQCTAALVDMAREADDSRNAGLTCERAFDSLTVKGDAQPVQPDSASP